MTVFDQEIRMRCVEQAITVAGRRQHTGTQEIIAIAEELCNYVLNGGSPAVKDSTKGGVQATLRESKPQKETVAKSG